MARTIAELPPGSRVTDYISLGVIAKYFPPARVNAILEDAGKASIRQRDLPAHVVVYYVVALALYMQSSYREVLRCLLEGIQWLRDPAAPARVAGKSGISQARTRLGWEPLKRLFEATGRPIATKQTIGAWYRKWRLVSLDGSTLDVADNADNQTAFGRPAASRGSSAYPQIRFAALLENGTRVLFAARMEGCRSSETKLAGELLLSLKKGMLCLADRYFLGYELWRNAQATGADLLWRGRKNLRLDVDRRLPDGSYLSRIYLGTQDWRHKRNGIVVRVIDYVLQGVADTEPIYRLVTTILEPDDAPAQELAALYHERWGIETAFDELKTHLRGRRIILRSKTPDLVRQEFYGLLLAHFAIRGLMHEAATGIGEDPDEVSFMHAVRVIRRRLPRFAATPPSGPEDLSPGNAEGNTGGKGEPEH
jgi:hypothetical protein